MKRIRLLRVITRYIKGGADRNVYHSINALLQTGRYEIDLIAGRDSDPECLRQLPDDLNTVVLDSLVRDISPRRDLTALFQLYRIIKRNRYQIVHTHTAKAGFLGRIAAQRAGTPCVIHGIHGATFHSNLPWMRSKLYAAMERWAGKRTDCFVSVGEELAQLYLQAGVGKPERYWLIRSGMELESFFEAGRDRERIRAEMRRLLGLEEEHFVAAQVGRLEPPKGWETFIDIAAELTRAFPKMRFLIVGDGSQREALEERARRSGLGEAARFLGYREDVQNVMAAIDALVICSKVEGLPQVAVQAAAVGVPIAAFRAVGVSEVVKQNMNGYTVAYGDAEGLARRIVQFAENPQKAREMGKAGRKIVGTQWTVETQHAETVALYDEAARRCLAAE